MIGVFDSGVGGLSSLRVLRTLAPQADLCYFADAANLPYGEKTPPELLSLSRAAIDRLLARGATAILAACGTVSSTALPALARECRVPLFGILDPLAAACARTQEKTGGAILVLGTRATVRAGVLEAKIRAFATHAPLLTLPCPDFVALAEELEHLPRVTARETVFRTLAPVLRQKIGTVALGCTHFSRLSPLIGELLPHAAVVDGAAEAAHAMYRSLPHTEWEGAGVLTLETRGATPLHLDL